MATVPSDGHRELTAAWAVADELVEGGNVRAAVACLEGLLTHAHSLQHNQAAVTRLRLAHLLVLHTTNLDRAKHHVKQVMTLVRDRPTGITCLLRAYSLLAMIHRHSGEFRKARMLIDTACDKCETVGAWHWYQHFVSQIVAIPDQPPEQVMTYIARGLVAADDAHAPDCRAQVYFQLAKVQVNLRRWDITSAYEALAGAQAVLTSATAQGFAAFRVTQSSNVHLQPPTMPTSADEFNADLLTLRCWVELLSLCYMFSRGGAETVQQLMASLRSACQAATTATTSGTLVWFSVANMTALCNALHGAAQRLQGCLPEASAFLTTAVHAVDQQVQKLCRKHVPRSKAACPSGGAASPSGPVVWVRRQDVSLMRWSVRMQAFLLENQAVVRLTSYDLVPGLALVKELADLGATWPAVLPSTPWLIPMLVSLYDALLCDTDTAVRHLRCARRGLHAMLATGGSICSTTLRIVTDMFTCFNHIQQRMHYHEVEEMLRLHQNTVATHCFNVVVALYSLIKGMLMCAQSRNQEAAYVDMKEAQQMGTYAFQTSESCLKNPQLTGRACILLSRVYMRISNGEDRERSAQLAIMAMSEAGKVNDKSLMCEAADVALEAGSSGNWSDSRAELLARLHTVMEEARAHALHQDVEAIVEGALRCSIVADEGACGSQGLTPQKPH